MTVTISKQFFFEAAHSLPHLHEGHKCRRMHGHSYGVTLHVTGALDPKLHWVMDYADVSAAWDKLFPRIDHATLNDLMDVPTTAENLAIWIYRELKPALPLLHAVEVQETRHSNARYQP